MAMFNSELLNYQRVITTQCESSLMLRERILTYRYLQQILYLKWLHQFTRGYPNIRILFRISLIRSHVCIHIMISHTYTYTQMLHGAGISTSNSPIKIIQSCRQIFHGASGMYICLSIYLPTYNVGPLNVISWFITPSDYKLVTTTIDQLPQ